MVSDSSGIVEHLRTFDFDEDQFLYFDLCRGCAHKALCDIHAEV
jgi:hypothetical protein